MSSSRGSRSSPSSSVQHSHATHAQHYGWVSVVLHWLMAALIIMAYVSSEEISDDFPSQDELFVLSIHQTAGLFVLLLVVVRLGWNYGLRRLPASLPTHHRWERILASIIAKINYLAMILVPLTGILMAVLRQDTIDTVLGSITWTAAILETPSYSWSSFVKGVHEQGANLLMIVLPLHVLGALKHTVIDRDATLKRMILPKGW